MYPLLQIRGSLLQQMHINSKNVLRMRRTWPYPRTVHKHLQEMRKLPRKSPYTISRMSITKTSNHKQETEEKKQQEEKQHQSYSTIIKKAIQETAPLLTVTLSCNTQIKLTALTLQAHIVSLAGMEKYSDILFKPFKLNYNIDVKFFDRDSAAIFKMHINKQHYPIHYNSNNYNSTTTI